MHRKKEKGSKQEETARIHKREAGPSLRPRGSHASPKSTDPAEAAPVPSMDPRCTGRSCAHLTYIFFAQCSWLELSGTPPEFWIPCQYHTDVRQENEHFMLEALFLLLSLPLGYDSSGAESMPSTHHTCTLRTVTPRA